MKYENKSKEEIGYEEMMEEMEKPIIEITHCMKCGYVVDMSDNVCGCHRVVVV